MFDHLISFHEFWGPNFHRVTALSFGHIHRWTEYDLDTLSLFPVLYDLTIFSLRRATASASVDYHPPEILKHLRILRVHGYIPPAVLAKLMVPALEELHLKADIDSITSIEALHKSFNPLCQHIHALLPEAVSATEPEWATGLSNLVRKCTRIRSLYISKWMEKECEILMAGLSVVLHVH